MTPRNAVVGIVALIVLAAGALWLSHSVAPGSPVQSGQEVLVRAQVIDFGAALKKVSLLSPTASSDIEAEYAAYVAPELLQSWVASTTLAPGRYTSSPWPDRIVIVSATQLPGGSWEVVGDIVEVTSTSQGGQPAALLGVTLTLNKGDGVWLITSYKQNAPELPNT